MIREMLCALPLPIKIFLAKAKNFINKEKRKNIKMIMKMKDNDYKKLNEYTYKKNLQNFLMSSFYSAKETKEYIDHLYNDKVELIKLGNFKKELPTIICVVKNEADKLKTFFLHYNTIGNFNYIFIDNGSTDTTREIIINNKGTLYSCERKFSTNRKLAWINKVYSTIPNDCWTLLLDADELLVYNGYENISLNKVLQSFDKLKIKSAGAVMIDMFSEKKVSKKEYMEKYIYFENLFHEEKSYYFNSVYGGIREREFKCKKERIFLIKKHPIIKKESNTMLVHCHYNYPFIRNFESVIYFGLLHYKLFDNELTKYRKIAQEGSYGNESIEYKTYLSILNKKTYEEIFKLSSKSIQYDGTKSLKKITCLHDVQEICYD